MYEKGNYDDMKEDLNIDCEEGLRKRNTVNEIWNFITKKIQNSTDKRIPNVKLKSGKLNYKTPLHFFKSSENKKGSIPHGKDIWVPETMRNMGNIVHLDRNQVRNPSKQAMREQEMGVAGEAKSNPKTFWSFVNSKATAKPGVPS